MKSGPNGFAAGAAATLAHVLLLLYPSSFRREMGNALVGDVRRRAADLAGSPMGVRVVLWLGRLALSLLINAVAAWVEKLPMPGASWLDVKLALRMLFRQPGLTLVATFALAIGIPVGLLPLHVLDSLSRPLPVEGGETIVMVRNYDKAASNDVTRPLHDFLRWRQELSSFEDLAMWRPELFNVLAADERAAPLRGSEVTASFFSVLRVPPQLGRPLNAADEALGAPDVVVIGHHLWLSRMGGVPDVIGKTMRIGVVPHTVIGVMPEGFLFPYRDHLWLPLRYSPMDSSPGGGPTGRIMGVSRRMSPSCRRGARSGSSASGWPASFPRLTRSSSPRFCPSRACSRRWTALKRSWGFSSPRRSQFSCSRSPVRTSAS